MQVIGVGERRYFNGHSEMTIIFRAANGEQVDMPASLEQVGFVMEMSGIATQLQAPPPRVARPQAPPRASSPLGEEEEVEEPIRLGAFAGGEDDGEPL